MRFESYVRFFLKQSAYHTALNIVHHIDCDHVFPVLSLHGKEQLEHSICVPQNKENARMEQNKGN